MMSFSGVVVVMLNEGVFAWKGMGSFSKDSMLDECISLDVIKVGDSSKIEGQLVGDKGVAFGIKPCSIEMFLVCLGWL